jgi:RNA polymerase sigma-70 factor (ECF subfamily)
MAQSTQHSLQKLSDEQLFLFSQSEPDAFGVLFDRYAHGFVRKATYILGDAEEAQDAVSETFLKLYSGASSYQRMPGIAWKSWAYRVLVNHCLSAIRSRKVRSFASFPVPEEAAEFINDPSADAVFVSYLDRDYLVSLIVRLPDVLARTVRRIVFEERLPSEVATEEGVSEAAVRVRMHRARRELEKIALHAG